MIPYATNEGENNKNFKHPNMAFKSEANAPFV